MWVPRDGIAKHSGRDKAERNAVAAVPECEQAAGKRRVRADEGQRVRRLGKRARRGAVDLEGECGQQAGELARDEGGLLRDAGVAGLGVGEVVVLAAGDQATGAVRAGVEVRRARFPDEGEVWRGGPRI